MTYIVLNIKIFITNPARQEDSASRAKCELHVLFKAARIFIMHGLIPLAVPLVKRKGRLIQKNNYKNMCIQLDIYKEQLALHSL